jgi:hypothetical protein
MSFGTAAETTKEPINYIKELMLRFPGMNIKVVGNLTWQRRKSTFTDQEHYRSLPLFQRIHHFQRENPVMGTGMFELVVLTSPNLFLLSFVRYQRTIANGHLLIF